MAIGNISNNISSVSTSYASANSPLAKKLSSAVSQQEASVVTLSFQAKKLSMVDKAAAQNVPQSRVGPTASFTPTQISAPAVPRASQATDTAPARQSSPQPKISINTYA